MLERDGGIPGGNKTFNANGSINGLVSANGRHILMVGARIFVFDTAYVGGHALDFPRYKADMAIAGNTLLVWGRYQDAPLLIRYKVNGDPSRIRSSARRPGQVSRPKYPTHRLDGREFVRKRDLRGT